MIGYIVAVVMSAADPSIALSVRPQACSEPCDIIADLRITNYPEEREVCLALFDEALGSINADPSRLSCWPYQGWTLTQVHIRGIPAGRYRVIASLGRGSPRDTRTLIVQGVVSRVRY